MVWVLFLLLTYITLLTESKCLTKGSTTQIPIEMPQHRALQRSAHLGFAILLDLNLSSSSWCSVWKENKRPSYKSTGRGEKEQKAMVVGRDAYGIGQVKLGREQRCVGLGGEN